MLADEVAETGTFGELLIDLEEDKAYKAVVWGLLREMGRRVEGRPVSLRPHGAVCGLLKEEIDRCAR